MAITLNGNGTSTFSSNITSAVGDLTLSDGNLVVANTHGIDFSATPGASGMTSELFDDYEEGGWTPVLTAGGSSIGIDSNDCKYVKAGKLVCCHFEIGAIVSPVASGMVMGGLPFVPNNEGGFPMSINNATFGSGYTYLSGHFESGGSWGIFKSGSGQSWARITGSEYSSASWFGTIVYRAS